MTVRLCECHGVEMLWHKDTRRRPGGYWRCRVVARERDRLRPERPHDPEKRKASQLRYWHKADGGYIRARRRALAAERADIQAQLSQLDQETHAC